MTDLPGPISDRIRRGDIPPDVQVTGPRPEADDRPHPGAVIHGAGYGLGAGATRARSGEDAPVREEHMAAVYAAIEGVQEMLGIVGQLRHLAEGNLGLVAAATGGERSASEAGRNAFSFAAQTDDELDSLSRHLAAIHAELGRYADGF